MIKQLKSEKIWEEKSLIELQTNCDSNTELDHCDTIIKTKISLMLNDLNDTTIPKTSGIYKIMNRVNGKCYIGSACNLRRRFNDHKKLLYDNKHFNIRLQNAWNKYGDGQFEFCLIELCEVDHRFIKEQYHFDLLKPEYNILKIAGGGIKGYQHSEQTKQLISSLQLGARHWSYSGEYVFYHKLHGVCINSMRGFSKISKLSYSSVHKLKCKTINSYNGWIFLGRYNSEFVLPKNLDIIYRNVLNRHKKYYAFYKNENNHFVGTVGEFIDKYKLKRDNIKGIVDQSRQSASDWICLGECDIHYTFPNNIDEIYKKRLSVNKRKHI